MTRRSQAVTVVTVGLTLLLGGCTAGAVAPPRTPPAGAIRLDVIGDSLSTGITTPGNPWTHQAQTLFESSDVNVQVSNTSENGAGYVSPSDNGHVFADLADQTVNVRSQIVLIFGSDNDIGQPHLDAAIAATLQRVKTLAPTAVLIVVGPPATPADPIDQLLVTRDALQVAARQAGGQFIDPIALGWFQGGDSVFIGPDGEHPNAAGEHYLAEKMLSIDALPGHHDPHQAP